MPYQLIKLITCIFGVGAIVAPSQGSRAPGLRESSMLVPRQLQPANGTGGSSSHLKARLHCTATSKRTHPRPPPFLGLTTSFLFRDPANPPSGLNLSNPLSISPFLFLCLLLVNTIPLLPSYFFGQLVSSGKMMNIKLSGLALLALRVVSVFAQEVCRTQLLLRKPIRLLPLADRPQMTAFCAFFPTIQAP